MDSHWFDFSRRYGWDPHPIDGYHHWQGKFAMVFEYDIRKEHPACKRAELINTYNGEYLFVVSQKHLDAICEAFECEPFEIGFSINGECLMPDCSGY